jgi:hypothetical protein
MDITTLIWINTLVLIVTLIPSAIVGLREVRRIADIQRAIFLQLRRQYQDIDEDLQEVRDLLRKEG